MKKEKTLTTNWIKGLLASQGIRIEGRMDLSDPQLEKMRLWDGTRLGEGLKSRLGREWHNPAYACHLSLECRV